MKRIAASLSSMSVAQVRQNRWQESGLPISVKTCAGKSPFGFGVLPEPGLTQRVVKSQTESRLSS